MRTITINRAKQVDKILDSVKRKYGTTIDMFVRDAIIHEAAWRDAAVDSLKKEYKK